MVDLRDVQQDTGSRREAVDPAYMQPSQSNDRTAVTDQNYHSSQHGYYDSGAGGFSHHYTQGEESNIRDIPSTTDSYSIDTGYYQDQNYNSAVTNHAGYYPSVEQQRVDWLSTNGDPATFTGTTFVDYYYVPDPQI